MANLNAANMMKITMLTASQTLKKNMVLSKLKVCHTFHQQNLSSRELHRLCRKQHRDSLYQKQGSNHPCQLSGFSAKKKTELNCIPKKITHALSGSATGLQLNKPIPRAGLLQ